MSRCYRASFLHHVRTAVGDPDRWMDDVTPGLEELRVSSAMSSPALTVRPGRRLVGIVSYIDILRSLRE
jgi:hypothetical protein